MTVAENDEGFLTGSFQRLRAVDFSIAVACSCCTRMLADMGAEEDRGCRGETIGRAAPRRLLAAALPQLAIPANLIRKLLTIRKIPDGRSQEELP